MAKSRARRRGRPRLVVVLAGAATVTAAAAFVVARVQDDEAAAPATISHVHGLGLNPADGRLYVATHFGVFALDEDGKATRVGTTAQDTMGFTVAGPNHFYASGHPEFTDYKPRSVDDRPLLGLIESRDAGKSWTTLSLSGQADFHGLATAHDQVFAWNATTKKFMVSGDGRRWETRSELDLLSFAVDPADPEHILASGSGLHVSRDGGQMWQPSPGPGTAFLSWHPEGGLWAATLNGALLRSTDGGATWQTHGRLPGDIEAFAVEGKALYASASASIFASTDGGETWRRLYEPEAA
jgi:photosystem II stability/assembly factor-like uncharacterized protein